MSFSNFTKVAIIIMPLFFMVLPYYGNAESWEVTVEKNNSGPSYYAGEGYGYYRRVPDKEIYYAPDIYVYSKNGQYYYQFAKLKPGEKFYLPFQKEEPGQPSGEVAGNKRDSSKYTTGLIYYPKGPEGEYLRNPVKKEEPQADVKVDIRKIYPLYFD